MQLKSHGVLLSAVILLATAGCASNAEDIAAAQAAKKLSGAELQQLVSGNSMTGLSTSGKSHWTDYYDPSGTLVGFWKSVKSSDTGKYAGTWSIQGDQVCYDMEGTKDDGCHALAVNGDKIYGVNADGSIRNADRPSMLIHGKADGV